MSLPCDWTAHPNGVATAVILGVTVPRQHLGNEVGFHPLLDDVIIIEVFDLEQKGVTPCGVEVATVGLGVEMVEGTSPAPEHPHPRQSEHSPVFTDRVGPHIAKPRVFRIEGQDFLNLRDISFSAKFEKVLEEGGQALKVHFLGVRSVWVVIDFHSVFLSWVEYSKRI